MQEHETGGRDKMAAASNISDRFLDELYEEECIFKARRNVVSDVQEAVEELVNRLIAIVSETGPQLKVKEIVKTGSYFEGTKIFLPDEFDFLAVLEILSKPGVISAKNVCGNAGSVHLLVNEQEHFKTQTDKSLGVLLPEAVNSKFRVKMNRIIMSVIHTSPSVLPYPFRIVKSSGVLELKNQISNEGPNTLVELQWKSTDLNEEKIYSTFSVGIDITPTIILPILQIGEEFRDWVSAPSDDECRGGDDIKDDRHAASVTANPEGLVYAVPHPEGNCTENVQGFASTSQCWRVSYFSQERAKTQSLGETHRKVYMLLKVLTKCNGGSLRSLTSYMMKNAVFHHTVSCPDSGSIGTCIMATLHLLADFADKKFLPVYFTPQKNLWKRNKHDDIITPNLILEIFIQRLGRLNGILDEEYNYADIKLRTIRRGTITEYDTDLFFSPSGQMLPL